MNLKIINNNFYLNLIIILSIFALDRLTKFYVIYLDKINSGAEIFSSKFLNIYLIWNEGIAFGLFSFQEKNLYNFFTIFIFIIITIITFMLVNTKDFKKYPLILILGGALGNFFDRIFYNAVPDFIDFHVGEFHWFIFNVADIFITFGVIFMILVELTGSKVENKI
jgi:signal peptidase II